MLSVAQTTAFRSRKSLAFLAMSLVMSGVPTPAAAAADQPMEFVDLSTATRDGKGLIEPAEKSGPPRMVARPKDLTYAPQALVLGQNYGNEVEPNGTVATATPLAGDNVVVRGNIFPAADVDFYSFTANAGDRVYVTSMVLWSAATTNNARLQIFASDGTTVLETDEDNGSLPANSPSIAGTLIPAAGTYYIRAADFAAANFERPYEMHFRLQSGAGAPTPEVEPNDSTATATPLPANGWVSGTRNPSGTPGPADADFYSLSLNAGDTVYLSLDLDPERDGVVWDGRVGLAPFGDASTLTLVVNDTGVTETPNLPSEAFVFTVKSTGTYFAYVDSAVAATGGPTATYNLSVSVHPATDEGVNCTTYTSTDVPKTIPNTAPPILVSSVLTVPGNPRIADVDVTVNLDHALMQDVDLHLRTPAGNDIGLATDIGNATTGAAQILMDITFDDEGAIPPSFALTRSFQYKPELSYRLGWLDGESAGGTWTLDVRDDLNLNGGNLTGWSIRVCEPPPPPACAPGLVPQTVFSTDFESGAAGFTHSGTLDEWELGLPAQLQAAGIAPFTTCNSGVNCWKTDLDSNYENSATQDLLSAPINLAGLQPPVIVTWAHRYQMESANFDHMFVDAQQVGGATPVRLYEWLDATMQDSVGAGPAVNIGESSGWSTLSRRADSLAGLNTELRFHVDSDTSVPLPGLAIDDVTVTACRPAQADLSITKTDGVTTVTPGQNIMYTITASNAGTDPVTGATVADTFPAEINCPLWTCVGAGGGTCTASGSGNINDTAVNLPVGGSVTYTASCSVGTLAVGPIVNTATVSSSVSDPVPGNNSATDTDTVTLQADLSITKTDNVTQAVPGQFVQYVITASNSGPSNSPTATVADTFPATLTCNWTCTGAGGGTCTASAAGNINDTVNLPAGGSVTYNAMCAIATSATGTLSNTATVAGPVTDPTPGNNSATDSDTLAGQADVRVGMTVSNATPTVGSNVTYTVTAGNDGPSDAHAVVVTDVLPSGLTFVSANPSQGSYNSGTGAWTVGTIPDTGAPTLQIVATVNSSQAIVNQASVTGQTEVDPNRSNNSALVAINAPGLADVQLQQTVDDPTPGAGQNVTFIVNATNAGPTSATSVVVTDNLPSGLTFVSATATQGSYTPGTGEWAVGTIASGASPSLQVTATVANTSPLTRVVQKTQNEPDYASENDTDSVTLNDNTVADLAMSLTASQEPVPQGTTFTYTIVVSNHGPAAATNVAVTDSLPAGLTLVSATATQGSCTGTTNVACSLGTLPDGLSANVVLVVTKTVGGNVSNTASVAATEADPFMANNSNSETSTPTELTDFRVE